MTNHEAPSSLVPSKPSKFVFLAVNRPINDYDWYAYTEVNCINRSLTLGLGWVELQVSWPNAWIPFAGR